MAAFQRLLSQARRHCSSTNPSANPSFSWIRRSLCSSSSSSPSSPPDSVPVTRPNAPNRRPEHVFVAPVAYPVKPKQESPSPDTQSSVNASEPRTDNNPELRTWSREDIRYMKDVPAIKTAAYPVKVAPLPEDRVKETGEDQIAANDQLEAERKRIESENRVFLWGLRAEEQKLPFPTLIKQGDEQKKKKEKTIHDLKEAIKLVKANAKRNFDETLEAHVKLAVDLRRTDLKLSGSLSLPHGSGKSLRVAVFAEGPSADEARAAGADIVGGEDLIEGIKNGSIKVKDIDKCIAIPQLMPRIGKEISKKLNRLTPNARDGSVTTDISRAVKEAKKNIDFKKDKSAIVHVGLGKVSFTEEALSENVGAFVNALLLAKPAGLKKSSKYAGYVNTFHICSTMGPSFPVSIQSLSIAADHYNKLQMR